MKQPPEFAVSALKQFGNAPGEDFPLWRLIWSNDKTSVMLGKLQPEYPELPDRWILEKWCRNPVPRDDWDSTRDWESGEYKWGDYTPGSYEFSYAFPQDVELGSSIVELVPQLIRAGLEKYTFSQRLNALREVQAKKERDWDSKFDAVWEDAKPAFGLAAFSGPDGHRTRGQADIPVNLSTDDIDPKLATRRGFGQF